MSQRRDGLLPRMQAIKRKKGTYYRYITIQNKHIGLGYDRVDAIRKVLKMSNKTTDEGMIASLWELYQKSNAFLELSDNTKKDYVQCSKPLLKSFGQTYASDIQASWIYRYLNVERKSAPIRANREKSLLSNLLDFAIQQGLSEKNPCKVVRRNKESPRSEAPTSEEIKNLVQWLSNQGGRRLIVAHMAEFAANVGSRQIEFLGLTWDQIDLKNKVMRIQRAKQRGARKDRFTDVIHINERLEKILLNIRTSHNHQLYVFPTRLGMPYTSFGFKGFWGRLKREALLDGVKFNATFHDLRSFYATTHKTVKGTLPNLHMSDQTTARIYDRNYEADRESL